MTRRLKLILRREKTAQFKEADDCTYDLLDGRGRYMYSFCPAQFHAATGFKLKPGEKQKIEIVIKKRK